MIKAILVDDEPINVTNLQRLLERHCPEVEITATANSVDEALKKISTTRPNLIFLDIQMPSKTGFDLLKELAQSPDIEVIFVTAYDHYGIQAVKFSALDYLLKPVNSQELKEAVNRASQKISEKQRNGKLELLIDMLGTEVRYDTL